MSVYIRLALSSHYERRSYNHYKEAELMDYGDDAIVGANRTDGR